MENLRTPTVRWGVATPTLQWGVATAPLPGQTESGDRFLVETFHDGALVAVVDALGHGHRAAQTAAQAIDALHRHALDGVTTLIQRCHDILRDRYGATMSVASFDWRLRRMTWLGVGNVAGLLVSHAFGGESRARRLLVRGGVVGGDLPDLHPITIELARRDTLILATDGIQEQFADHLPDDLRPQPLAEHIFTHYAKSTDDALVLVARYCVSADDRKR
ncbi:MAG TPA: SpoIIE family protein phosphatase [Burkholderiaceae bacterium]|jgi:serine/threonine protein phosphatase PrpC|nr:SpoIIE family protein phosphatase [Burkholderiaceae bacterium]